MIIYNVTVKIQPEAHNEWLKWMNEVHIPDVMKTGMFIENKMCKMLTNVQPDGETYAIQYLCKDMATLEKYQAEYGKALQADHQEKFKDKYVAFRTLLEVVGEHK